MGDIKRPILVWLVLAYFAITALVWVISASVQFSDMTLFDFMMGLIIALAYLAAAIILIFMRKMALFIFLGALGLELVFLFWGGGSRIELMTLGGDTETTMEMVNVAISVVSCIYASVLMYSGKLD